jgi:hypothetical protein
MSSDDPIDSNASSAPVAVKSKGSSSHMKLIIGIVAALLVLAVVAVVVVVVVVLVARHEGVPLKDLNKQRSEQIVWNYNIEQPPWSAKPVSLNRWIAIRKLILTLDPTKDTDVTTFINFVKSDVPAIATSAYKPQAIGLLKVMIFFVQSVEGTLPTTTTKTT